MFLFDNPVLQRELLVNLRMKRAFVLLFVYVGLLGAVVFVAWPTEMRIDMTGRSEQALRLVNMFFLGQYLLIVLMTPSFAAGALTREKEGKTYEMLLASPMRPAAIVLGKLLASLCHLAVLVFASLPIVMLCLPLGGVSPWEVFGTYTAMTASVAVFGMISVACSCRFTRTVASLLVSYMAILPLALIAVLFYRAFAVESTFRLVVLAGVFPAACLTLCGFLLASTSQRLLYPPDVGSEAKEVVDLEHEQEHAVGLVIHSDQFPDRLFAPAKRTTLLDDRANPVFDKEMRSELFSQGSLMLRLVIQVSMILAWPLMAVCLFIAPKLAPWFVVYVVMFNVLVGPVFAAGAVTNERERETLELLLTTTLSPWQILWGKLLSSLRISVVLTAFLVLPLLLAWILPPWTYVRDSPTIFGYVLIIALASLTTTVLAVFCSVLFRTTTVSLMTSYLLVILLFLAPLAIEFFAVTFFPEASGTEWIGRFTFTSPMAAAFALPLWVGESSPVIVGNVALFRDHLLLYGVANLAMLWAMIWLFNQRWRVT